MALNDDEPLKLTVRGTNVRTLNDWLKPPSVIEEAVKEISRAESARLEAEALALVSERMGEGEPYEVAVAGVTLVYEQGLPPTARRTEDVPAPAPVPAVDTGTGRWECDETDTGKWSRWFIADMDNHLRVFPTGICDGELGGATPDDLRAAANILEKETGS